MATRSTIKDWFVNHTKSIRMVINTLDHTDVVSMPVMPIQWNSVSQEALTWTMLVDMAAVDKKQLISIHTIIKDKYIPNTKGCMRLHIENEFLMCNPMHPFFL